MRVALYSRVSTRDKGQDPANQTNQMRDFCSVQGWSLVEEYTDHDSGTKSDRVQFQRMLKDASVRKFDLLLFWALDRFTREGTLATLKYLERLKGDGISWRSFTEPWIDSAGPFRDVIISLLASLAAQEKIRLSERIRAGLDRAKREGTKTGNPVGRPRVVFRRDRIIELRTQGLSWQQIARQMGVSRTSVRRGWQSVPE
jgi:DNA invertase Pin-like site-specific DNA recombinase